ncbi:MAG: ribonuclease Y [Candidatus Spechtbacterales bacterium]|nr:ribonuclease Y [Candidatus Spechtbacterales bacterium]
MESISLIIMSFFALVVGLVVGYLARQAIAKKQEGTAEAKLKKLTTEAKKEADKIVEKAKVTADEIIEDAKKEEKEKHSYLLQLEKRLLSKEEDLEQKHSKIKKKNKTLAKNTRELEAEREDLSELKNKHIEELEKVANMSSEEAREKLFKKIEEEHKQDIYDRIKKLEEFQKDELDKKAKMMIVSAMQRYAASQTQEVTTTAVSLPSDDIKGRIIGKEGRNIKTLERLVGVELIVDDTPETIIISGFDAVRRHIAKLALEKLIADGRIQPARIEDAVLKAKEEINEKIKEAGEAAVYDAGIVGMDTKLVWLLGRLRFRTSYGQNVLMHSLEVCHIAGALAGEIGADISVAKKGGLLHDIGKAVDHEVEGSHVDIGIKLLEKYGISQAVIDAMKSHHEEYPYETLESRIVQAADAISASRPGARKDTVENYLQRLAELENVASSFDGVEKAYAIQAGREVRVFVTPDKIDDFSSKKLARDIAKRIQDELKYPGEIKVTLIRETRVIEYAR